MGNLIFDISMSLDGFMTAANQRPEEPLGEGGEVLTGGAGRLGSVQTAAATHLRFRVVR
jgi:hypothetical protein